MIIIMMVMMITKQVLGAHAAGAGKAGLRYEREADEIVRAAILDVRGEADLQITSRGNYPLNKVGHSSPFTNRTKC